MKLTRRLTLAAFAGMLALGTPPRRPMRPT